MKYHWIIKAPFYIRKPHACPQCAAQLQVDRREKEVRVGSAEAERFDLHITGGPHLNGWVKVRWKEFFCPKCDRYFTIDEVKRHEGIPV